MSSLRRRLGLMPPEFEFERVTRPGDAAVTSRFLMVAVMFPEARPMVPMLTRSGSGPEGVLGSKVHVSDVALALVTAQGAGPSDTRLSLMVVEKSVPVMVRV